MSMQSAGIEISPETIGHILQEKGLRVPLSQRSYRWGHEHVEDLYKDINAAILNNLDEYFLGSIVGIKSQGLTYIYDGQQRLATSMILIAAIRDYFYKSGDEETARLIEGESLISKHRQTHEEAAHFRLNAEDHQFFHSRILLRPDNAERRAVKVQRESHKRIEAAAKIASDFIRTTIAAGLPPGQASNHLHRWLDFIKDALRVIWVQVANERTAFTIFETMNDRGLKLSAADLPKNYLYAISEERRDEVIQKWQSMTAVLETIEGEEENIVEYVRCFWITKHGHTRTKFLYDNIKEKTINKTKALNEDARIGVRNGRSIPHPGYENDPTTELTWAGVLAYCRWRCARLPRDVEWEAAARGREARPFPWGSQMPSAKFLLMGVPARWLNVLVPYLARGQPPKLLARRTMMVYRHVLDRGGRMTRFDYSPIVCLTLLLSPKLYLQV